MPGALENILLRLQSHLNDDQLLRFLTQQYLSKREVHDPAVFVLDLKQTPVEYYLDYFTLVKIGRRGECAKALSRELQTDNFSDHQKDTLIQCGMAWMIFDEESQMWLGMDGVPPEMRWAFLNKHGLLDVLMHSIESDKPPIQCVNRMHYVFTWLPEDKFLDFLNLKVNFNLDASITIHRLYVSLFVYAYVLQRPVSYLFQQLDCDPAIMRHRIDHYLNINTSILITSVLRILVLQCCSFTEIEQTNSVDVLNPHQRLNRVANYLLASVSMAELTQRWLQAQLADLILPAGFLCSKPEVFYWLDRNIFYKDNNLKQRLSTVVLNFMMSSYQWQVSEGLSDEAAVDRYQTIVPAERRLLPLALHEMPVFQGLESELKRDGLTNDNIGEILKYRVLDNYDFFLVVTHYRPSHIDIYNLICGRLLTQNSALSLYFNLPLRYFQALTLNSFTRDIAHYEKIMRVVAAKFEMKMITQEERIAILESLIPALIVLYHDDMTDPQDLDELLTECVQCIAPEARCDFFIAMNGLVQHYWYGHHPLNIVRVIPYIPEVDHERYLSSVVGDVRDIKQLLAQEDVYLFLFKFGAAMAQSVNLTWHDETCFLLKITNYVRLLKEEESHSSEHAQSEASFEEIRQNMIAFLRAELASAKPRYYRNGTDGATFGLFLQKYCPYGESGKIIREVLDTTPASWLYEDFKWRWAFNAMIRSLTQYEFVDIMFGNGQLYEFCKLEPRVSDQGWMRWFRPNENNGARHNTLYRQLKILRELNRQGLGRVIDQFEDKKSVMMAMFTFMAFLQMSPQDESEKLKNGVSLAAEVLKAMAALLNFSDESVFQSFYKAILNIMEMNQYSAEEKSAYYHSLLKTIPKEQVEFFRHMTLQDGCTILSRFENENLDEESLEEKSSRWFSII